jgi:hypothetical protein
MSSNMVSSLLCSFARSALANTFSMIDGYLRSMLRDAKFDRGDPDSLSCKFLARIFLRESWPHEPDT